MSETKYDVSFLQKYSDELNDCFRMYTEDINPFIIEFEVEKGEFPIELQNEIRSIYSHLCKAAIADTEETVIENIKKIKSHSKRALLDCFKYISIIYIDMYNDFMSRYKNIDLTYIKNGQFLSEIDAAYAETKSKLRAAKEMELKKTTDEELFSAYQEAFYCANDMKQILSDAEIDAAYLKKKASKKDILCIWSFIIGVAGFIVGVLGFVAK